MSLVWHGDLKVTIDKDLVLRQLKILSSDDEAVNKSALTIKNIYRVAGERLYREGLIDNVVDNYIPRQWKRTAIEANRDEFGRLLVNAGEAENMKDDQG